jgi:hypothetical protein
MKKSIALLSTMLLVGATASGSFVNANALLTAPNEIFDIAFRNDSSFGSWYYYLGDGVTTANNWNWSNPGSNLPTYTRTTDGAYYNYTNTTDFGGLQITQTFNRSNTGWQAYLGGPNYLPYLTNSIGSNSTVGSIANKIYLKFDNQTNKDYYLYVDIASSVVLNYQIIVNGNMYISNRESNIFTLSNDNYLVPIYIPSYSFVEFKNFGSTSGTLYLDAFYLQDLGESDAYANGFTDGYNDGQNDQIFDSPGGIFAIIGSAFGAVANVFNIDILPGGITLGVVFGAIIALAVLFSFLNLINATPGMGSKKK